MMANKIRGIVVIFAAFLICSCGRKTNTASLGILKNIGKDLKGYKIAFASPRGTGENQDIWTVNADGTGERNLTESLSGGFDIYPEWSPNAKYIYYTSNKHEGETLELYRVNTIGVPKPKQITSLGKEVRSLSISPENKHIALGIMSSSVPLGADLKPYSADLYILDINKMEKLLLEQKLITLSDLQLVLSEPVETHIWHEQPDWEPGKTDAASRIVYVRTQNYDDDPIKVDEIWSTNMDGSNNQIVSKQGSMPRWTRDGKKIATHEFFVIDIASNKKQKLFIDDLKEAAGSALLSPNQKYVLFETTDRKRLGGIAKVTYKKNKNPYTVVSKRPMYEPRWSPVIN